MKNIKILSQRTAFSLLIIFMLMTGRAFADSNLNIKISGEMIVFNDELGYPFVDKNGRTQVPLRVVMDKIGATTSWDPEAKVVSVKKGDITVQVPIGTNKVYINGLPTYNDTYSVIQNGRTYLPIRKVLELIGYDVTWHGEIRLINAFKVDETKILTKANLPRKYDLREHGKVGEVKDQGFSTDCWAYSTTSAIESALRPNTKITLSPKHIVDHSSVRLIYETGGTPKIASAYLNNLLGPVLESDDPSSGVGKKDKLKPAVSVLGTRYIRDKDLVGIKKAIYEHGAVTSSLFFYNNSYSFNQNYNGSDDLDHAVTIIGWDDDYDKDQFKIPAKKDGAFIVLNSYGTDFHDNGIFYVSYEDLHIGTDLVYFTDIEPGKAYNYCYSTFDFGITNWSNLGTQNQTTANVFDIGGTERTLMAVGLASMNTNLTVNVYLIKDFKYASDFLDKEKQLIASSVMDGSGYFPIKLSNPVTVSGRFAILVEAKTTDEVYKIPMEQPFTGKDSVFDLSDGEGYYEFYGSYLPFESWQEANLVMGVYLN